MSEKSYVSMAIAQCPVCLEKHNTGILLDRRMKDSMDSETFTGHELCETHKDQKEDGYVFLIEVETIPPDDSDVVMLKEEEAVRTGVIIAIRSQLAESMFDIPPQLINFIPPEVTGMLQEVVVK